MFKNNKQVLSFREAVVFLDVSKSYLYKLTANKEIIHFKPTGKRIYFLKTDLIEWVLQNKQGLAKEFFKRIENKINKSHGNRNY